MTTRILSRWLAAAGAALMLGACGGDEETLNAGTTDGTQQQATTARLQILTDTPQLPSDGSDDATITALALDENNNTLADEPVTFSASSGVLSGTQTTTDDSGEITRTLEVGGNPENRTITVTAESGSASASVDVEVTGTTLTLEGPSTVSAGTATEYSAVLRDSAGNGVAGETVDISTTSGTLSATTLETDSTGQVDFTLTTPNDAELTVSALMLTASQTVTATQANFEITTPNDGDSFALQNLPTAVDLEWLDSSGSPVTGQNVTFSTTRGSFPGGSTVQTDGSGIASTTIDSTNAGVATITASGTRNGETVTDSVEIEFVATQPAKLTLQADPDTVQPEESSTIRAIVRDVDDNPVKGATVDFTIDQDTTSGTLSSSTATTDSQGVATVTYTAGNDTTKQDGVKISAAVRNTSLSETVSLTVSGRAVFLTLGTGNTVIVESETLYRLPYVVRATDINGNAIDGLDIQITIDPQYFLKGEWQPGQDSWVQNVTAQCTNEDGDRDGEIDSGEDADGDGKLEPGQPASPVPGIVTTDSSGSAEFEVEYPKDRARWVIINLTASAAVDGTESSTTESFTLPILADDVSDLDVEPPGRFSPFGTNSDCTSPD